jgi:hypothetical protein
VPLKHSHFFTAEDRFGSRDDLGDQVDDDSYRLAGHDTVVIGGVRFRYRIAGNEVLRLFPELPACARRGCFEAQWAVAVSYNGLPWHRIG